MPTTSTTAASAGAGVQPSPPAIAPAEAASPAKTPAKVASPLDRPFLVTIDRYYQMIEAGIFDEKERVFLWKGWLVEKMTKNQPHTIAVTCLYREMSLVVPDTFYVSQEQPIAIVDDTLPEPDLTVVRGKPRDYPKRPPTIKDVVLVIEVADSSLAIDKGEVLNTYAAHGIPIYWVVNIPGRQIEVYSEPTGPAESAFYKVNRIYTQEEDIPVNIEGREVGRIAAREILP